MCFNAHGKASPLSLNAPAELQRDELAQAFQLQRQINFGSVRLDP